MAMAAPPDLEAANCPEDAIEVGRIADAWGVKGWFKVLPHSADPEALFSAKRWFLQPSERGAKTFAGTVLLNDPPGQGPLRHCGGLGRGHG
jgi:16S rRNA processing protein RimM